MQRRYISAESIPPSRFIGWTRLQYKNIFRLLATLWFSHHTLWLCVWFSDTAPMGAKVSFSWQEITIKRKIPTEWYLFSSTAAPFFSWYRRAHPRCLFYFKKHRVGWEITRAARRTLPIASSPKCYMCDRIAKRRHQVLIYAIAACVRSAALLTHLSILFTF